MQLIHRLVPLVLVVLGLGILPPQQVLAAPQSETIEVNLGSNVLGAFGPSMVFAAGDTVQITSDIPLMIQTRFDGNGEFLMNGLPADYLENWNYWNLHYPRYRFVPTGFDGGYSVPLDPPVWIGKDPDNFHFRGDATEIFFIIFVNAETLKGQTAHITFTRK